MGGFITTIFTANTSSETYCARLRQEGIEGNSNRLIMKNQNLG